MKFKEMSKRKQFVLYQSVKSAIYDNNCVSTVCALGIYTQTAVTSKIVSVIVAKNRKCGEKHLFIAVYRSQDPVSVYLTGIT